MRTIPLKYVKSQRLSLENMGSPVDCISVLLFLDLLMCNFTVINCRVYIVSNKMCGSLWVIN